MENATTIVLSRLVAQSRAMDVTATNIANASTPGFRAERVVFADFIVTENRALSGGERSLTYTADRATYREARAGTLTHTANPLDLAIVGNGFFTVQTKTGPKLTRAGHFGLSATGTIVDDAGDELLDPTGRPLEVSTEDTHLSVAADGSISSENGPLGRVAVVVAADEYKLKAEGSRLYSADGTTTTVTGTNGPGPNGERAATIVQGAIEGSNIEPTSEIAEMMRQLREFQFATQFVQSESDREQAAIDKILQTRT